MTRTLLIAVIRHPSDDYRLTRHGPAGSSEHGRSHKTPPRRCPSPVGACVADYISLRRLPLGFQGLREVYREQNPSDHVGQYSHGQQRIFADSRHLGLPVIQEHLGSVPTHRKCDMQGTASSVKKCKQPVKMHRRSWWRPVTRRGTTDVLTWSVVEDAGPASLSAGCLGWHYYCEQRRGRRPRSGRSPGGHAGLGHGPELRESCAPGCRVSAAST